MRNNNYLNKLLACNFYPKSFAALKILAALIAIFFFQKIVFAKYTNDRNFSTANFKINQLIAKDTNVLTGLVTNDSGNVLEGVTVSIKNTRIATQTNAEGKFVLRRLPKNAIVVFSSVGYLTQETPVAGRVYITAKLLPSVSDLEDVVVSVDLGYGNVQKRKDLTGSIGTVNMKELQKAPVRSFEEALAGRVAGVQVQSLDGQPGDNFNIVVRGASSINNSNSPLYIIDGLMVEDPNNNNLNPNEIESITVLKDASSTAIYGSRAANGVVIINTKQGNGKKANFSYKNFLE